MLLKIFELIDTVATSCNLEESIYFSTFFPICFMKFWQSLSSVIYKSISIEKVFRLFTSPRTSFFEAPGSQIIKFPCWLIIYIKMFTVFYVYFFICMRDFRWCSFFCVKYCRFILVEDSRFIVQNKTGTVKKCH